MDVTDEENIFKARDPKSYEKLEYAIFLNKILEITKITKLYVKIFKYFIDLKPEDFVNTKLGKIIRFTENQNKLERPEESLSLYKNKKYFFERNRGPSKEKIKCIKYALKHFGLEDELFIKYAEPKKDD